MRITAELLQQGAEQRTNPLNEREMVLRGHGIGVLENLGALAANTSSSSSSSSSSDGSLDALDLSNNRLTALGNFPRLPRLTALYASHNPMGGGDAAAATSACLAVSNLARNLPHVTTLTLCYNRISSLATIVQLAQAFPNLTFLSLRGNPVTHQPHYRLCVIWQFLQEPPNTSKNGNHHRTTSTKNSVGLTVLDYQRIRPHEQQQARKWATSTVGATVLAQIASVLSSTKPNNSNNNQNEDTVKTFVPGQGLDEERQSTAPQNTIANWTPDQKAIFKQLLETAKSEAEMQTIQRSILEQGMAPEAYLAKQQQTTDALKRPIPKEEEEEEEEEEEDQGNPKRTKLNEQDVAK